MKRIVAIILFCAILSVGFYLYITSKHALNVIPTIAQDAPHKIQPKERMIFVPYWTFVSSIDDVGYNDSLYFGLNVNANGVDTADPGYAKTSVFTSASSAENKILTIRMLSSDDNSKIMSDKVLQEEIILDSILIAQENGYDGIALDYETSALGFAKTTQNISEFYRLFAQMTKKSDLLFYAVVYSDTYYRGRPFDLKVIGEVSDKVVVMTYDFHKSRGNPGPNFPLLGKGEYGYDMTVLLKDLTKDVPFEKIVITLGYFGYDWEVSGENAIKNGEPMSTAKIEQDFVDGCIYSNCEFTRNNDQEPSVSYINGAEEHVIWFEDKVSVTRKEEYLSTQGVNQIAYWAYSYY